MVTVPDSNDWYVEDAGFPHPDWKAIRGWIKANVPEDSLHEAWNSAVSGWLTRLKSRLDETFHIAESKNFFLLSQLDQSRTKLSLEFLENTRAFVRKLLGNFALAGYFGKHVCIVFRNPEIYYGYASHFYKDDGEYAESGGMFIKSGGYLHFIVQHDEVTNLRSTLAHELTHNCMAHLPLPTWLNEAITKDIERTAVGTRQFLLTRENVNEHHAYWNPETIQEFWSGKSWENVEGNSLSYSLATILLNIIHQDLRPDAERFRNFLGEAHFRDAGESAAQNQLGVSLGEVAEVFLGPGDWTPKPPDKRAQGVEASPMDRP